MRLYKRLNATVSLVTVTIFFTTMLTCFLSTPVRANVLGSIGNSIADGLGANELIDRAKRAGSDLIEQGQGSGNALLIKEGNEIDVSAQNAAILADKQLDKRVGELKEQQRIAFENLYQSIQNIDKDANKAYHLKETAVLDAEAMLGRLPLGTRVFTLSTVTGLVQMQRDSDYQLTFTGSELGFGSSDAQAELTLKYIPNSAMTSPGNPAVRPGGKVATNDPRLRLVEVSGSIPTDTHTRRVTIPNNILNPLFQAHSPTIMSAYIFVKFITQKRGFLGIGRKTVTQDYEFPLVITLLPKYAGEATLTVNHPIQDWVAEGPIRVSVTSANHDQDAPPTYFPAPVLDLKVDNNHRLVNPRHDCVPSNNDQACSFVRWGDPKWDNPEHTEIELNASTASKPVTLYLIADKQVYKQVSTEAIIKKFDMNYGELSEVDIPSDTTDGRVQGKTVTNLPIDMLYNATSGGEVLSVEQITNTGNITKVFIRVKYPEGMN